MTETLAHTFRSRAPRHDKRWVPRVLEVCCNGCALLLVIQLPGALFDYSIRREVSPPEFLLGAMAALTAAALVLHRLTSSTWLVSPRPFGATAVAFALAALFAQVVAPAFMSQMFVEASDVGVLIPTPGSQRWGRGGKPHVFNELGLRGSLPQRATPNGRLVAFVGDSFIFGAGVGEEDAVPAVVARGLSDLRPPVAVVNAGIPGLGAGSFPGVIRYVKARLHPDVIVVLIKDDDIDETDILSRWNQFRRSFWYRLLYVTNVEPIYETIRLTWRHWLGQRGRRELLGQDLSAIADAASGAKLLVLAAFTDDLRPVFSEWLAAHPDTMHVSAWEDPRYSHAERIPHDGHWSKAGCADIAGIVTPPLHAQLSAFPAP